MERKEVVIQNKKMESIKWQVNLRTMILIGI